MKQTKTSSYNASSFSLLGLLLLTLAFGLPTAATAMGSFGGGSGAKPPAESQPASQEAATPSTPAGQGTAAAPLRTAPRTADANGWDGGLGTGISSKDRTLGSPDAPVVMIEYASMTCIHCANFHNNTFDRLQREYIDQGIVRLVYRDLPLDQYAFKAAQIARCMPESRFFPFVKLIYSQQEEWSKSSDPVRDLRALASAAGLSPTQVTACLEDRDGQDHISLVYEQASKVLGVSSTPTFFINGEKYSGSLPFGDFQAAIEKALR